MNVLLLVAAIVFLAVVIGVAVSAFVASVPVPENRQAPPAEGTADRERARAEALRKIAERARRQQQREASARISRGF